VNELATEFDFALPKGYVDSAGTVHREGTMRLATAGDEILPQKDSRVQSNPAYLVVVLLSRVITRLGSVDAINPRVVEGLFASDLAYLQEFYNRINSAQSRKIGVACPHCQQAFEVEPEMPGES
jgi:hypothetical protein